MRRHLKYKCASHFFRSLQSVPFDHTTLNFYHSDNNRYLQQLANMHSKTLLLFSLALGVAVSQDLEVGDYPAQCNDSCGQVATASDTCDEQNDDDQGELNCVCNTQNMDSLLPECLTCLSGFRNTEDYNEGYQGKLRSTDTFHYLVPCADLVLSFRCPTAVTSMRLPCSKPNRRTNELYCLYHHENYDG